MQLKISKSLASYLGEHNLRAVGLEWNQRSYQDYYTLDLSDLTMPQIERFREILVEARALGTSGPKVLIRDIDTWVKALNDAGGQKARTVNQFSSLLIEYIRTVEGHRVYRRCDLDGVAFTCYYVNDIEYHPENRSRDSYHPAYARMELLYYELGGRTEQGVSFHAEDIQGMTASEALAKAGYYVETPELRAEYLKELAVFNEVAPLIGKQYYASGTGTDNLDGNPSGGRFSSHRTGAYVLDNTKVVIDVYYEDEKERRDRNSYLNQTFWARARPKAITVKEDEAEAVETDDVSDGLIVEIEVPVHPFCAAFDLRRHLRLRVHINYLTEYVYDLDMGDKLILPQVTKDLVATLIKQSRSGFADIVEGKGMGVTVLLGGAAGVGKTLTAEVFAEASEKPLYSIQAAQLGISANHVEANITQFLARGSRWGAIVLIDEADVYIRARDKDMEHNAIVASLLRVLEYQTSILFMTTNLAETVDDAIVSRCIARINYQHPSTDDQAKIWRVLADLNSIPLKDTAIAENVKRHPTLAGRDIKQLLKLACLHTAKSKRAITPNLIDFVAQFQPTIANGSGPEVATVRPVKGSRANNHVWVHRANTDVPMVLCTGCGLEVTLDKKKHGGLGKCPGKA